MAAGIDEVIELFKIVGGPATVACLGWWLRGKFSDIDETSKAQLNSHEQEDERRHRQNLVRFAKINMKLGIRDHDDANGGRDDE